VAEDLGDESMVAIEPAATAGNGSAIMTTEAQASIECVHRSDDDNDDDLGGSKVKVPTAEVAVHRPSINSAKSEESEPNEMQSLMTGGTRVC